MGNNSDTMTSYEDPTQTMRDDMSEILTKHMNVHVYMSTG